MRFLNVVIIAFGFIISLILIKYKPAYKVSVSGEEIGYIESKKALAESIYEKANEETAKNIEAIYLKEEPQYELKLIDRKMEENKNVEVALQDKIEIIYKYYEIFIDNNILEKVNTIEEAEELINKAKENNTDVSLNIVERHTANIEEVNTTEIEVAKQYISDKVQKQIQEQKAKKEEEERINAMPSVNGIKLATKPITGVITSRYGESSRLRKSNHTGLDIAAEAGTPIKVVADGTVISAENSGSYGNLVKISHGNGVETLYAHTSKMYVDKGDEVKAGEIIAAVGTTGNSTGPHLHFEIRINGTYVNPQNYLYN